MQRTMFLSALLTLMLVQGNLRADHQLSHAPRAVVTDPIQIESAIGVESANLADWQLLNQVFSRTRSMGRSVALPVPPLQVEERGRLRGLLGGMESRDWWFTRSGQLTNEAHAMANKARKTEDLAWGSGAFGAALAIFSLVGAGVTGNLGWVVAAGVGTALLGCGFILLLVAKSREEQVRFLKSDARLAAEFEKTQETYIDKAVDDLINTYGPGQPSS